MGKKIMRVGAQIIATAIIYAVILWLFDYIFDDVSAFDWALLVQGLIFAVIFVPLTNWSSWRRKK